ncbi:hypothetical protein N7499_012330 [Penicillium canescens]|nr:hypothetical protein N7499_012330 [Penicillium canescens]KAJ6154854.1 hypothetical protein N7485_013223 [Penicillium canescens]
MKIAFIFLGILTFFSRTIFAQKAGGSKLAHSYEAIYLYYGYLVDVQVNKNSRTIGAQCEPTGGRAVCTGWEFIRSIQTPFDAGALGDGGKIGAVTLPGDLKELANTMVEKNFNRYNDIVMFRSKAEREQDLLQAKKEAVRGEWGPEFMRNIKEKQVVLEGGLATFSDIDWYATAVANAEQTKKEMLPILAGFEDFARHMSEDSQVDKTTRDHLRIVQSIRSQSDSLGSLAACEAR